MESRKNIKGKTVKAFVGQSEKQCNRCGFSTFSLYILYNHRYKCRGKLLGHTMSCPYCKRKFNFLLFYKRHKAVCVKKHLRKKFLKIKLTEKHLGYKIEESSFSCPICEASFKSKEKFVSHLKKQTCKSPEKIKKFSLSARKSFSNRKSSKSSIKFEEHHESTTSWPEKHALSIHDDELFRCLYCKSYYPSAKLLKMHFEMNFKCADALQKSRTSKRYFSDSLRMTKSARKSIVKKAVHKLVGEKSARKSFPGLKHQVTNVFNHKRTSRSAIKTFPSSSKKLLNRDSPSSSKLSLYECPVCFKDFSDMFLFYQHQKKMNHWGKAAKSITTAAKCPFCQKEFMHVSSRNAHVQNHSDIPKDKIKAFLKSSSCSMCSKNFASEQAKVQHMRIQHPKSNEKYLGSTSSTHSDSDTKQKMSSVPRSVKKKLKQQPNICPVCSKGFTHTVLRNKHFNEAHLKIFECQFCNTKFKSMSSLNNHVKLSHGSGFECKGCKIRFKDELQLLQHVLKSHPNKDPKLFLPVKLQDSDKEKEMEKPTEVSTSQNARMNNNSNVFGNMEFYCDVCNIGYLKLCGLQRHRQSKLHKDTLERGLDAVQKSMSDLPPSPALNPRVVKQPEILTCSECSDEFTNIRDFVPHRLSHFSLQGKYLRITERNPYMCEICSEVLDSHSKVQLHLFWHLQIESTASRNVNTGSTKKETIVPDRLSGQHVAKKSFSKQKGESLQEVIIGGVSKPIFTCENCNVGFTTKEHFNVHVRKLCKVAKPAAKFVLMKNTVDAEKSDLNGVFHCVTCNFIFSSSAKHEQHKPFCLKMTFDCKSEDYLRNLEAIKSALVRDIGVSGCVTCGAIFDSSANLSHLNSHQDESNTASDDVPEDVVHCALCNCLFPFSTFKKHRNFCKIPIQIGDKESNSKHIDVLKSALELKCALAGCITCGEPFDDLETFVEHLNLHQTNKIPKKSPKSNICNGEGTKLDVSDTGSRSSYTNDHLKSLTDELETDSMNLKDPDEITSKSLNSSTNLRKESETIELESKNLNTSDDIEKLRNNFSKLLCLLIADTELMEELGYGTLMIENVLENVLKQMGQEACFDKKLMPLERFRKNIQILLDLCLKDQVMQAIGKDKIVDEIVSEALNIFDAEDSLIELEEVTDV